MKVTFFGHKNTPQEIQPKLEGILADLIENDGADTFYVGNQGCFDFMVRRTLQRLKKTYPHITYTVVLAYMPGVCTGHAPDGCPETIYPEGMENTPLKFAIIKRNQWMIDQCDTVVTHVKYPFGGAARFKEFAEKKGKRVINITCCAENTETT
ncbi:MAG: hypothetical protein KHW46_07630 [Clostridiales bacterium]|nr:hypothetical protein [Clostridiales bacterium]